MLDFFSRDPAKIVEKCSKLRLEGKLDKAENTLKKHIKNSKNDYPLLMELANVYFDKKKYADAALSIKSAYYLIPENIDKIINILEDMHYRADLKLKTGALLIELYLKKRNSDSIHKIIKSMSKSEIDNLMKDMIKKSEEIIKTRSIEQLTKKDKETLLLTGILALDQGDYSKSHYYLERVFKSQPSDRNFILSEYMEIAKYNYSNPAPYMTIGDFYLIIDDKDNAITYYQRALKIEPELKDKVAEKLDSSIEDTANISETSKLSLLDVYLNKNDINKSLEIAESIVNENTKNINEFIRRMRKLIENNTSNIKAHKIIIKALIIKKDYEQAIIYLNKILEISNVENDYLLETVNTINNNGFANIDLNIIKAKALINKKEYEQAAILLKQALEKDKNSSFEIEETLNKLLSLDEQNIYALQTILEIYLLRAQPAKAKIVLNYIDKLEDNKFLNILSKYYLAFSNKYPKDTEFKLGASLSLIKSGDFEKASDIIISTIEQDPNMFYEIIPHFYEPSCNDKDIAKSILRILIKIDKNIDEFLYNYTYAEILYLAGEIDRSIEKIVEMLENNPDKENEIFEIVERMSIKYPGDKNINEFKFNHFIKKQDFDKALEATLELQKNEEMTGHVLDNLFLLLKHQPNNPIVIENILKIEDKMGMYEKIINDSARFIKTIPEEKSGMVRFYLGKAYAKKGQVNDASVYLFQAFSLESSIINDSIELLKELLKIDYSSQKLHYSLAHAYQISGDIKSAVNELMNLFSIDKSQFQYILNDLINFYNNNQNIPELTFAIAKLYLYNHEYKNAVSKLKETYELDKNFIDNILNLLNNTQQDETIESGEILFAMGFFYSEKQMYKAASDHLYNAMTIETSLKESVINQLQLIINKQPNDVYSRYSLAQVYIDMRNYVQAIQLLRQIETINPAESENIIQYYQSMLSDDSKNTILLLSLADSYMNINDIQNALNTFNNILSIDKTLIDDILEKLLETTNKTIDIQLMLSHLYKEKGMYEEAVNWLNSVYISDYSKHAIIKQKLYDILNNSPKHTQALILLSKIHYNLGEYEELTKLSTNIFEDTKSKELKFRSGMLLAQAYRKMGNYEKADDIILKMKNEDKKHFYNVLIQFYEEEKSSRIYNTKNAFEKNNDNESIRIQYAKYLLSQKNYDAARNILLYEFKDKDLNYERIYLLAKISEASNNIMFALEIASPLRHSDNEKHISYLIKLFSKLGYFGEIDSLLKKHPEISITMSKYNLSKNIFREYKVLI